MSLVVRVAGVDMEGDSHSIAINTFQLTNALGQRDTLSVGITSKNATYRPINGAQIEAEHSTLGMLFGGFIQELSTSFFDAGLISHAGCSSWELIFDHRFVGKRTYVDQPAGDIFEALFDDYLGAEDLTASIVVAGPNITVDFDFCTVREAYDKICELASDADDTYMWDCTPGQVTRFYKQTSFAASFDLTNSTGHIRRPIVISDSFGPYANKVFVRQGNHIRDAQAQTYTLDGSTRSISYEIPIAREPSLVIEGIEQTLGIRDKDTGKDWYWSEGSPEVTQDAGGTTPAADSVAVLTAQGYEATVIDAGQNDDEVDARATVEGGSGLHMVVIENMTPGTSADAIAVGHAYLDKFSKPPRVVEYVTDYYGDLRAGQYQRIAITHACLTFDETFIIESVTLSHQNGQWLWSVRAVFGALVGDWMAKLRKISSGTAGGASVGGSSSSFVASVEEGYIIRSNGSGPFPASGDTAGIYSGLIGGAVAYTMAHAGAVGGIAYAVGAQANGGTSSSLIEFGDTGTTIITGTTLISLAGPVKPSANNTYAMGASAHRWSKVWSVEGDFSGTITSSAIVPSANNTYALGGSSFRWSKVWAVDADFSGLVTFSGHITGGAVPVNGSAVGLYIASSSGDTTILSHGSGSGAGEGLQIGAQQSGGTNSAYTLYDQSGTILISATGAISVIAASLSIGGATSQGHILPSANNTYTLGNTSFRWSKVWSVDADCSGLLTASGTVTISGYITGGAVPVNGSSQGLYVASSSGSSTILSHGSGSGSGQGLQVGAQQGGGTNSAYTFYDQSGTVLIFASGAMSIIAGSLSIGGATSQGSIVPSASATYDLGSSGARWAKVWSVDEDLSGTITKYNNVTTVGMGVVPLYDSIAWTNYSANASGSFTVGGSTPPAGLYRCWVFMDVNAAGSGTGTATLTVSFSDGIRTTSPSLSCAFGSPLATYAGMLIRSDGSAVTWSLVFAGHGGGASVNVTAIFERVL